MYEESGIMDEKDVNPIKINPVEIIKQTAVLVLICVAVTGLLAYVHTLTAEPIRQAAIAAEVDAMRGMLPADVYREIPGEPARLAVSKSDGLIGCIITTSAKGYGGDIVVLTAFLLDGTVERVKILSMQETPGVGTKVDSPAFLDQFVNAPDKAGEPGEDVSGGDIVSDTTDASGSDTDPLDLPDEAWAAAIKEYVLGTPIDTNSRHIDGITGATISSKAMCAAVTEAAQIYDRLLAEGKLK